MRRCGLPRYDEVVDLVGLTADRDPRLRAQALAGLALTGSRADRPEVWRRLGELTSDPDHRVRRAALQVAAGLLPSAPTEARGVLELYRSDADPKVVRRAERLLAGVTARTARTARAA